MKNKVYIFTVIASFIRS